MAYGDDAPLENLETTEQMWRVSGLINDWHRALAQSALSGEEEALAARYALESVEQSLAEASLELSLTLKAQAQKRKPT